MLRQLHFLPLTRYLYLILYCSIITLVSISTNYLIIWFLIESSILIFIGISYSSHNPHVVFTMGYYVVQARVSTIMVLPYPLLFTSPGNSFLLLQVLLFVKLAVYPFFMWYYTILLHFPLLPLFLALAPQKLPALLINLTFVGQGGGYTLLLPLYLRLIFRALGSLSVVDYQSLLIWSSLLNTVWLYLMSLAQPALLLMYFGVYRAILAGFIIFYKTQSDPILLGLLLLRIVGFPPFPLFFAKLYAVFYFCRSGSSLTGFLSLGLLTCSVVVIVMYFRQYMFLYILKVHPLFSRVAI